MVGCEAHSPDPLIWRGCTLQLPLLPARRPLPGSQTCSRCGQVKPFEGFSPSPSRADCRDAWCETCRARLAAVKRENALATALPDPEVRCTPLVIEWRLNVPMEQAVRVALLIDPRPG